MRNITMIILLSLVEQNDTKDSRDKLVDALTQRLADKLAERAVMIPFCKKCKGTSTRPLVRSMQNGDLDHATLAKSGANSMVSGGGLEQSPCKGRNPGGLNGERKSILTSSLKARLKAPFSFTQWKQYLHARSSQNGPRATSGQVDSQSFGIPPRLALDLQRPVNDEGPLTKASAEDRHGYLGRLAPFPGVSPDLVTPAEAASVTIAGLTPREKPENHISDSNVKHLDDFQKVESPEEKSVVTSADASEPLADPPRSATIDSDIDSDIMNSPRRKAPPKFSESDSGTDTVMGSPRGDGPSKLPWSNLSDRDGESDMDVTNSPTSSVSGIDANVMKAWRYSHGAMRGGDGLHGVMTPARKIGLRWIEERQVPAASM